ncbi:MAG: hypothetical protein Q9227_002722 [Pyrenula ochraceoflavens]
MGSRASRSGPADENLHEVDDGGFLGSLEKLFNDILDTLANSDAFSRPDSPSSFVVYAHNNPEKGIANAEYVNCLIQWLKRLRARTLSDRSPVLSHSPREDDPAAIENILSNQFCLLPANHFVNGREIITSVDKVILCGSSLLKSYCQHDFTHLYVSRIKQLYNDFQHKGREGLQRVIRNFVERQCNEEGFHHVLTELAFVALRFTYSSQSPGVIPFVLCEKDVAYLPFFEGCDHYIPLKSPTDRSCLHKAFFGILQQLYTEEYERIDSFRICYTEAKKKLENKSPAGSQMIIKEEISKALDRYSQHRTAVERDRKNRNPERLEGTCIWFTDHERFQRWRYSESSRLLWVSADPGCGKSVLTRYLVDHLLLTDDKKTTCYFFFKDDFEDQKNIENALRCLLHQLFLQKPALLSDEILRVFKNGRRQLNSFTGLWKILLDATSRQDAGEIIFILDALDECQSSGQSQLYSALNNLYNPERITHNLKFLLTSRPYSHIQRNFRVLEDRQPTIHLSGENEKEADQISQEVNIVIRAKVQELGAQLRLQSEEQELLQDELTRFPNRTYLWVFLVFDVIKNIIEITPDRLRASVRKLPQTVNTAYEKILCQSRDPSKARKILHIIVAAKRPLSLQEMAVALYIEKTHQSLAQIDFETEDRFRETIRALCGLFVTVFDSKIYLLHQTAREFLIEETSPNRQSSRSEKNSPVQWQNSFRLTDSNSILAEVCIWYVRLETTIQFFKEYAASNWCAHFRKAGSTKRKELAPLAEYLCDPTSKRGVRAWGWPAFASRSRAPLKVTALIVGSAYGLEEVVYSLLEQESDLGAVDGEYQKSALSWACENGHESVAKILLSQGNFSRARIDDPLLPNPKITEKLTNYLSKHDFVNSRDKLGQTPLHHAVSAGNRNLVNLLIENKADLAAVSKRAQTPLLTGIFKKREAIVQLLLEKGADIKFHEGTSESPLAAAVSNSSEAMTKLLLDKGADTNERPRRWPWWTPLHHAACTRSLRNGLALTSILLDKGANIEATEPEGCTPLHMAVRVYPVAVVELLLDRGANIEARNAFGCTPLHEAVWKSAVAAVELLLDRGADLEAEDDCGMTPLLIHCTFVGRKRWKEEITNLLLAKGANIEARNVDGCTPLMWAAFHRRKDMRSLLVQGGNTQAPNVDPNWPLSVAIQQWHYRTVKLLLKKGATIEARDITGTTPLLNAVEYSLLDVVKLLLEKGADIKAQNNRGETALSLTFPGDENMRQLLLENGAQAAESS